MFQSFKNAPIENNDKFTTSELVTCFHCTRQVVHEMKRGGCSQSFYEGNQVHESFFEEIITHF